jgi:hypothetical protein
VERQRQYSQPARIAMQSTMPMISTAGSDDAKRDYERYDDTGEYPRQQVSARRDTHGSG